MHLETLADFSIEEVLPIIPRKRNIFKVGNRNYSVKTSSLRLQVFKRNLKCAGCDLIGSVFKLQKQVNKDEPPHFNLYAVKNNEGEIELILMTQDHIYPRSKGGKDNLDNLQTMCLECNSKKGSTFSIER